MRGTGQWAQENPITAGLTATGMAPVPVVSDVAGLAGDVLHYYNNPEDRTLANYGLSAAGALPFVPSVVGAAKGVSRVGKSASDKIVEYWSKPNIYTDAWEGGGQRVGLIMADGRSVFAPVHTHNLVLREAGVGGSLEEVMQKEGMVRVHGVDNFEVYGKPTPQQAQKIAEIAEEGGIQGLVAIDVYVPEIDDYVSDFVAPIPSEINRFFRSVERKKASGVDLGGPERT